MFARLRWMVPLFGVAFAACGGVAEQDANGVGTPVGSITAGGDPVQPLCDGSDDVRWIYAVMIGIASFQQYADNRFGTPHFFAIDGRCNYWSGGDGSVQGIVGGSFDAEQGRRLSQELQFGRYGAAAEFRGTSACVDGLRTVLSDGTGVLDGDSCSGAEPDAPFVWSEAFNRARSLTLELDRLGETRWKPTRLTISVAGMPSKRAIHPWAAPLELGPRAVDLMDSEGRPDSDSFSVLIEDEATLAALDSLRRDELAINPTATDLFVRDADEHVYRLALRDVGPAKVVTALQSLLTHVED